ncbi:Xaa-Pro peptidase family protein [Adlercreutzia equolifaciens]|uniref:Xaa-Pro peptidase family protein n=1 Tax=Adlercreutzia equolifaciens TaxID=446660 RepID=UPI0031B6325A
MTVYNELYNPVACEWHVGQLLRALAQLRDGRPSPMVVRDTSNIHWITAFDDVFDDEAAHALYISGDRAVLHTDSRYATACEEAARRSPIRIDTARESHAAFVARQWNGSWLHGMPEAELQVEDTMTLAEYRALQKAFPADFPIGETDGLVLKLRAVKDPYEVARMRGAQSITDAAFSHIIQYMKPGMTERQVQLELEEFMLRHGAQGLAFPSIVATGANGASPHAIPGATMLEAGQCVVLDFGAKSYGYCSDMTRTVFLGEPEGEMRAAWDTLRAANEAVEAMLAPGVTGKEAHELAESVLAEGGFAGRMGHGLGHGVGLDIHEEPVLAPRNEQPLVAGNVVTVEPGIYLPGKFGMRLEDFGVITDDGFDVFTKSTHEMVVI